MNSSSSMASSSIQGQLLEVTVVGCSKLKNTEWISRQDPYVCVEYASSKFRTRTDTDGGKNPTFQEKFSFGLIEGLRELNVIVWNSNTVSYDDFIGSGKVQLQKVLSQGYDDSSWTIQSKTGRYAGEVRLIMHYANANSQKPPKNQAPTPYGAAPNPQPSAYSYPPAPAAYPPYAPPASAYPSAPYPPNPYPPAPAYPAAPYPPPPTYPTAPYPPPAAYPAAPYPPPSAYPAAPYPPPSAYPPGPYPGTYRPPY